jgi:hypothetical protein
MSQHETQSVVQVLKFFVSASVVGPSVIVSVGASQPVTAKFDVISGRSGKGTLLPPPPK